MTWRNLARVAKRRVDRVRGRAAMSFGRAASARPLSIYYGFDRGTPIDRLYIERFLDRHAGDIRGDVLEVGDATYMRRFGGDRVAGEHILDIDAGNDRATIIGDLGVSGGIPAAAFDCIICTQTLQFVFDLPAALRNLRTSLRPGGVLLITVPGVAPVRAEGGLGCYWSFTSRALRRLLEDSFGSGRAEVVSDGNLFAATAFLHGAALEEVSRRKLDPADPAYPVIVTGRAVA